MNHTIYCDLCRHEFTLTASVLKEYNIDLMKEGFPPHPVTATFLTCPRCGKQYPVIVDDETTLPLLEESRQVYQRCNKYIAKQRPVPQKLQQKQAKISKKLGFYRRKLAEKYKESYYQLEDGSTVQLDYCYREHTHG